MAGQWINVSQWLPAGGRAGVVCLLEDTWEHFSPSQVEELLLASSGERPGMPLPCQHKGQPTAKKGPAQQAETLRLGNPAGGEALSREPRM